MKAVLFVLRHEIYTLVSRFSFWFGVLGVPVLGFLIYAGINWVNNNQGAGGQQFSPAAGVEQLFQQPEETRPQGYIDPSGLIRSFPGDEAPANLIKYTVEAEALADLNSGTISAYYVIPADYVETGQLKVFVREFNLIQSNERSAVLRALIAYNLLGGDLDMVEAVQNPTGEVEETNLAPETAPSIDPDSGLAFLLPYSVMMFFFISIMGSAGMLLSSVGKEKENRIMEVLLLSITPHQMLLGKIIGLGLVGLLQVVIWGLSAFTLLQLSGESFNLPPELLLDPSILFWGLIFFVLGYLVYAALLAGIGALVPNMREASQATFVVTLPMMVPLFLLTALIDSPNGALATGFSLFPLTAPTSMMLRLASTSVPLWQILLSIVLLILTTLIVIRLVAGLFKTQILLSGQPLNIKRLLRLRQNG